MKTKPLISVVMPAYNAGEFLVEAVESILLQTYQNFEFIIVDDASIDGSLKILKEYKSKDKRIKVYRNEKNRGVSNTVKKAISLTHGDFIARMDADDIALPTRLEKQIEYLLNNKKTVAIGTQCALINKEGEIIGRKRFPTKFEDIYKYIFKFVPLQQPTLMVAKNRLSKNFEYYVDGRNTAEEIELLFKLFMFGKVENLEDELLMYRLHDKNTSFNNVRKTFLLTLLARIKAIFKYGYKPTISGVLITLMQTFLVLVLPQRITLSIYRTLRDMSKNKASYRAFKILSSKLPARV